MSTAQRDSQIVQAHAAFICEAVELIQRPDARGRLDELLRQAADAGWDGLAEAVRQFARGQREIDDALPLDDEDRAIAAAILRGLQDPATLPDPSRQADPALAAPGLAAMIHAAARGDVKALSLVSEMAGQMCAKMDARGQQLVLRILEELGRLDLH
jgi:hypothetical protein